MNKLSFLFLPVYFPGGYSLAEATAERHATHAVSFYDWFIYRYIRPTWPSATSPLLLQRSMHVFPPGYAGHLEWLFRFYLQSSIKRWCQQLQKSSGEHPWVITLYPYLASWTRIVPRERLVYYNIDDYVLYRPERKERILEQEDELIERAAVTLCVSQFQVEAFRKRHPHKSSSIYHYPLGVADSYLNLQPQATPKPQTVGYVGNLIERMDWRLIYQVAQACPDITFVFVGGLDGFAGINDQDWKVDRQAALALPNVRHLGEVPQAEVVPHYWSFNVSWIPYAVDHPFNRASCPTKIMDGIASGRPLLSTDIPECRLYPEWITIFHTAEEAVDLIRQRLGCERRLEAQHQSMRQLEFARQQTWAMRAQTLEGWLAAL